MGKRSVGGGVWLVFGALVLIAMAPKEVWIGLGVIGGIALAAYFAIKYLGQKANGPNVSSSRDAHRYEPTLAELIAANQSQQPAQRPARLAPVQPMAPPRPKRCARHRHNQRHPAMRHQPP